MRFPPERMVLTGYGEFHPILENTNDDNRAANRRVEIKIIKALEVADKEAKEAGKSSKKSGDGQSDGKTDQKTNNQEQPATPVENK